MLNSRPTRNPVSKGEKWGKIPVLVTFYCCDKTSWQRQLWKGLFGGIWLERVSPSWQGIMAAGGRHCGWNSWALTSQTTKRKQREHSQNDSIDTSKPVPMTYFFQQGQTPNPPQTAANWGPCIQMPENMEASVSNDQNTLYCPLTHTCAFVLMCPPHVLTHIHMHTCTRTCFLELQIGMNPCCRLPSS